MATADATGVRGRDLSGYIDLFRSLYRERFGQDLALEDETVAGQLIGLQATAMAVNDEALVYLANAMSVARASGRHLDDHGSLLLIPRLGATRTSVEATLTGVSGTIVPAGSKARTRANALFETRRDVVLDARGRGRAVFSALDIGPVACGAGELNNIVTLVSGWETVANAEDATQGRAAESDGDYRVRLRAQSMRSATGPIQALRAAIIEAGAGVKSRILENHTAATVVEQGVPILPHSVLVIADGGPAGDIQAAILRAKSAGCGITAYMASGRQVSLSGIKSNRAIGWQGVSHTISWANRDTGGDDFAAKIQAAINKGSSAVEKLTRVSYLPDPRQRFLLSYPWLPDGDYTPPTGNLAEKMQLDAGGVSAAPGAFARPTRRLLAVEATITAVDGFPADGLDRIKRAVRAEADGLGIGEKPWPQNFLQAMESVPGTQVTSYSVQDGPSDTAIADVTMPLDRLYHMDADPTITVSAA